MKPKQKPKRPHWEGRQSKADLEGWLWVMQEMIAEMIRSWPEKQQIAVLDSLQQALVQRLNWLMERQGRGR